MWKGLKIAIINLIVLIILLAAVEAYFRRAKGTAPPVVGTNGFALRFIPYQMFSNLPHERYGRWQNTFTNELVPIDITTNNEGFNDHHEFNLIEPYKKAPNERVVVVAGGSVVWGVGSSSPETAIAGRIEHYLNSSQQEAKYTVINLGMGNYIAYQEFIALELWGGEFRPDWVVVMDGPADGAIGCAESQGVMNPQFFAAMSAFINGYFSTSGVDFYRGWLENEIIKYSVAYRSLTHKEYIPNTMVADATNADEGGDTLRRKVVIPTKVSQSREMAAFYLKAEDAMIRLYPDAGYIMSTAPSVNSFHGDFTDVYDSEEPDVHRAAMEKRDHELDTFLAAHEDEYCNSRSYIPSFVYIVGKGAFGLERLADSYRARGRQVEYQNIGKLLPEERDERKPYFIDSNHLSEKGADLIGKFYAERILAADRAEPRP
jgi:hypothetical protein